VLLHQRRRHAREPVRRVYLPYRYAGLPPKLHCWGLMNPALARRRGPEEPLRTTTTLP
jgi:hypothetical protein